ncbi:LuxR C-terminal-related transcriptional regulator [Actinomycetospora callitridis]|uniref:LuxR C-terminal-related transcriptional regulator n=1 Tax=Actinomycetospora callitridis TaxID=913944 RepID=UPI0023663597|nr:LuxR C-terminal-related transcriptional regulator [Actinomycetospora callitridis]MDD7917625.1 LuxR C-terminal-related transcriptional regulator [Actinomycetospora callitridis]
MTDRPSPQVIGRARERAQLAAAADPRRTDGTVTVLAGEPGSGKSTLLDEVVGTSSRRVLRTAGVESEAVLPFVAVADLLMPLLKHVEGLPEVQREALEIALALRAGTVGSPLAVCAAALGTFASAADAEPLLLVVDDFPWIDAPSQQVLMFVARRLGPERIALLLSVRSEVPVDPGVWRLPTIELGPLSAEESRALVEALPVRASPRVVETIVERCAGNPLAVVEIARAAGPDLLVPDDAAAPALPPGSALERTWSAAIDALPEASRTALAVLAHSRTPCRVQLEPVFRDLGIGGEDLAPAERRRLALRDGEEVCLRHGLLRPLIAARTSQALRRRVLDGLARHAPPDLAVWYLAEAGEPPDDELAERLVDAAHTARQRAGLLAAARTWARAADFTADPVLRAERLLAAATDASMSGGGAEAVRWCERALAERDDVLFAADVEVVRTRTLSWLDPARAVDQALRTADAVLPHDPQRAARLYGETVMPLTMMARLRETETVADQARALDVGDIVTLADLCHTYVLVGRRDEAHPLLDELLRRVDGADLLWDAPALATGAQSAVYLERFDEGRRLVEPVATAARQAGAPLVLSYSLAVRAEVDWWAGRWPSAYADVSECVAWADELGQAGSKAFGLSLQARIEAVRGDTESCRAHADEAMRLAVPLGVESLLGYATGALGAGALAAGDVAAATAHLERARRQFDEHGARCLPAVPFAGDLVDATARAGDRTRAEAAVAWVAANAERTGSAYAEAIAARGRGLLADDPDAAERWFAMAHRAHERFSAPYEKARTTLAHAEVRRRWRRPGAARPLLLEAEAAFAGLGAHPWTERTRHELAATGHRTSVEAADDTVSLEVLTPQEFQIARGVAEGLSNVEVSAALFVSRKTVEAHLTRVYRKLGVRSRTELAAEFTRRRDTEGPP